jgi:hypothetical protein
VRNWKSQHNPLQILERFPNEYLKKLWDIRPKPVQPPQFDINLQSSLEMSDTERTKFAVIVEQTSMLDYIKAGRKWATNEKKEELSVNEMLFLVFRAGSDAGVTFAPKINTTAIAYMAFCLAQDDKPNDNRNVVYIWELHVSEAYRGQGTSPELPTLYTSRGVEIPQTPPKLSTLCASSRLWQSSANGMF